jgi:hypothetical protein
MIKAKMMGVGTPPMMAQVTVGTVTNTLTASGSTQGTALAISDDVNIFTTVAASTGTILPGSTLVSAGDNILVVNYGANALTVYPPTGGKINNGSANAGVSVAANKNAEFVCINGTDYIGLLSA